MSLFCQGTSFSTKNCNSFSARIHGFAMFVSLVNVIRAACLFNERKTFTLLFALVSWPFINLSVITRVFALAFIVHFTRLPWTLALFSGYDYINCDNPACPSV